MKGSLIALAVSSVCAGAAYADDSALTLYGVLDAGILTVDHSANFNSAGFIGGAPPYGTGSNLGATSRATGLMSGGESLTRWGTRGAEDMGGGMKAFFQLESGFSIENGQSSTSALANTLRTGVSGAADSSQENQLFGRSAFVGVSDAIWGALSGGRVTSVGVDIFATYDPVNSFEFSPLQFSGGFAGGGVTDTGRVDSALKYVANWDGFNLGLVHKFGGVAGSTNASTVNDVNIGWELGDFGIQAAYEMANDTTKLDNNGVTVAGVLTPYPNGGVGVTFVDTRAWLLVGKWQAMSALNLKAGFEHYTVGNPSNPAVDATMTTIYNYPIGHISTTAFTGTPDQIFNTYWLGGTYNFTSATRLSLGYYHVTQNDFSGGSTAVSAAGKLAGDDVYYSGMLEYMLSKRTNLYAAVLRNKKSGGVANAVNGTAIGASTGIDSYTAIGAGIRHFF
jgi:predicted porin